MHRHLYAPSEEVLAPPISGNILPADPERSARPELAIIIPTFNERENIAPLIYALTEALGGCVWEAIFVDDDSPDGTHAVIAAFARNEPRIRLVHRVGRRGLSSACVEGVLATTANVVAVMDADLQHDESILPVMLERLRQGSHDVIVATRNGEGGSMGQFSRARSSLSGLGKAVSRSVFQSDLSDPMSGFFMLRRSAFLDAVHHLHGGGFKILLDLLVSSPRPLTITEVGYTFRTRQHGESKLNALVGIEFLILIVSKLLGFVVPLRIALFSMVGTLGVLAHLVILLSLTHLVHMHFAAAQATATVVAMLENFFLNNSWTFRSSKLEGPNLIPGLTRFLLACTFGALINVVFAHSLRLSGVHVYLAGLGGIVLGSVWNLSVSSAVTWKVRADDDISVAPDHALRIEPENNVQI